MIRALVCFLLVLLLGSPAQGWVIKAPKGFAERLRADEAVLPPCVMSTVSNRLRIVYAAPHLTKWPNDATSWPQGFMILNTSMLPLDTAYIHELGHYYDWETGISDTPAFQAAVEADFSVMTAKEAYNEHFLRAPQEAFAELFAAHFRGDAYWGTDYYDVWEFPNARRVLEDSLCK